MINKFPCELMLEIASFLDRKSLFTLRSSSSKFNEILKSKVYKIDNFVLWKWAISNADITTFRTILNHFPPIIQQRMIASNDYSAFGFASDGYNLEIMRCIYNLTPEHLRIPMILLNCIHYEYAASVGCIETLRQIHDWIKEENIEEVFGSPNGFIYASESGHLEVLRFLYDLYPYNKYELIDTDFLDFYGFRHACLNDHFFVVKQLYVWASEEQKTRMIGLMEFTDFLRNYPGDCLEFF